MKQKIVVPALKPRNPWAVPAIKRVAGTHTKRHKALRRKDNQRGYRND